MDDRRRDVALFRYSLIREAADERPSRRERGALVRSLAERDHVGPDGERVRVGRSTLDRWIRAYRAGGFEALVPDPRVGVPRTPTHTLELAVALKTEAPRRTAAQVAAILATQGLSVHERTLQRHFARLGLTRRLAVAPRAYGRFEAEHRNELWTGDALHGPALGSPPHKTYLFAFIDDHSRLLTGYRWGFAEDTVRLEAALRRGLESRGTPDAVYVDNGSAFCSAQLLRALASLRVRIIHSKVGEPAGRGKIERFFRTVRDQFLVEVEAAGVDALSELNALFSAWVESVYHRRRHSETGEPPVERFLRGGAPALSTPEQLHEAFLWSERRQVAKTATVSLHGNVFEVDPALVGRRVELVFDPFDLGSVEVRYEGRSMGVGVPRHIARHSHPKARPEPEAIEAAPTGIDYLRLIAARHEEQTRRRIAYSALPDDQPSENEEEKT